MLDISRPDERGCLRSWTWGPTPGALHRVDARREAAIISDYFLNQDGFRQGTRGGRPKFMSPS